MEQLDEEFEGLKDEGQEAEFDAITRHFNGIMEQAEKLEIESKQLELGVNQEAEQLRLIDSQLAHLTLLHGSEQSNELQLA